MRRGAAAVVLSAVLVLGAAACGGDDSGDASTAATTTAAPTTTAAALTADQFRQQANAVCADYQSRLDAIPAPDSPDQISAFFGTALPLYQEFIGKLQAISPPPELKADYDAALGSVNQILAQVQSAKSRIDAGEDPTTVVSSFGGTIDALQADADQKAIALGLNECADDDETSTTGTTTASTETVTPPADTTGSPVAPGSTVDTATFVKDIQAFAQSLTQFGLTLQAAAEGPEALRARSGLLRQQLDEFDAITARMSAYTVDVPALEQKRAAIVAASPDISRLGRELLTAAEANDEAGVQRIATEFIAALERLRTAATS